MEEEERTEGWVFRHREGDRMKISDMDKAFQQGLSRVQLEEVGMIPEGVELEEYMSLRISLRIGSTKTILNNLLVSSVIEANNRWSKIERGEIGAEYYFYIYPGRE